MDNEVKEEIKKLANKYQRKGNYKDKDGNIKYIAAAVEFEDKTGLTGVAGRYKMLDGMTHPEAEYDFREKYQKYALAYKILSNPEKIETEAKKKAAEYFVQRAGGALKRLNKDIDKLSELNPEIKKLSANRSSFFECYHAVIGLTSQYNIDDVNLFVDGKLKNNSKKDEEYFERAAAIKEKAGMGLRWTLSPATLTKVEKQLGIKREKNNVVIKSALAAKKSR